MNDSSKEVLKNIINHKHFLKYKNFYFLLKNSLGKKKIFPKFKFKKGKLFDELTSTSNERIILLKINKPSYLIDDIIIELYEGNVQNYEIRNILINMFKTRNNWLTYYKSLLDIIEKTIKNIERYHSRTNFWDYSLSLAGRYYVILQKIIGKSVMDVGTSSGLLPLLIKKKYSFLDVNGSDIYPLETISYLAKNEGLGVSFKYLDITNINSQNKKYDTVIFSDVLEHFPKEMNKMLIANLLKLTKKRLIIHVPQNIGFQQKDHLQTFELKDIINLGRIFSSLLNISKTKYSNGYIMIIDKKHVKPKVISKNWKKLVVPKENTFKIKLHSICNNNCKCCDKLDKKIENIRSTLDTKKTLKWIREKYSELIISGGELALREDIFEIIDYAKGIGFKKVILETNGRLFCYKDFCEKMVRSGIDQFNIYLYSHNPEVHDKITRVKGSWKQTVEGIKNLVEMKQNVQVNVVICKENYRDLNNTVSFLKKLDVCNLHIIFIDENIKIKEVMPEIFKTVIYALCNNMKITFNKYNLAISILTGDMLVAPKVVQFGLANACNNSCVYCVNHSPYLDKKTKKSLSEWKKAVLDFTLFKKYVDESSEMGVKRLELSGGGEPFVHPKVMEMIDYAKKGGMNLRVLTNLNLVSKDMLKKMFDYGVNEICINFSAATAETYVSVHPNQSKESFYKLINDVSFLTNLRKNVDDAPQIRIIFVICKLNYHELYEIAKLAKKIKANFIEFKIVETTNLTRRLQLTKKQFNQLKKMVGKVENFLISNNIQSNIDYLKKLFRIGTVDDEFTENLYRKIGCFIAWHYCYITPEHFAAPCTLHPGIVKINGQSFSEIWNSKEYNLFRRRALDKKWRQNNLLANRGCIRCPFYCISLDIYNESKKDNLLQFLK